MLYVIAVLLVACLLCLICIASAVCALVNVAEEVVRVDTELS